MNIRNQLINAVQNSGFMSASYHFDRLRADIDNAKCLVSHCGDHKVKHSMIRKITANRYRELRNTWNMLTC